MKTPPALLPGHSALRRGRASVEGQIYLVTFVTWQRKPLFENHLMARQAASSFTQAQAWQNSELLAWVLMPDHWHGLIQLGRGEELSVLVGKLKSNTSRTLHSSFPALEKIWARAFHDRALRRDDDVLVAARYLILNPVRAGIAKRVGDYPYWDASWLV